MEEWKKGVEEKLYRQIVLLSSNIKPVFESINYLSGKNMGGRLEKESVGAFVDGFLNNLDFEAKAGLIDFLAKNKDFYKIKSIAGNNKRIQENLDGYQGLFNQIIKKTKVNLAKPETTSGRQ